MSDEYICLSKYPKSSGAPEPKASDLIEALQEAIRKYGDLPVFTESSYLGGAFNGIHFVDYEGGSLLICYHFE